MGLQSAESCACDVLMPGRALLLVVFALVISTWGCDDSLKTLDHVPAPQLLVEVSAAALGSVEERHAVAILWLAPSGPNDEVPVELVPVLFDRGVAKVGFDEAPAWARQAPADDVKVGVPVFLDVNVRSSTLPPFRFVRGREGTWMLFGADARPTAAEDRLRPALVARAVALDVVVRYGHDANGDGRGLDSQTSLGYSLARVCEGASSEASPARLSFAHDVDVRLALSIAPAFCEGRHPLSAGQTLRADALNATPACRAYCDARAALGCRACDAWTCARDARIAVCEAADQALLGCLGEQMQTFGCPVFDAPPLVLPWHACTSFEALCDVRFGTGRDDIKRSSLCVEMCQSLGCEASCPERVCALGTDGAASASERLLRLACARDTGRVSCEGIVPEALSSLGSPERPPSCLAAGL